MNQPALILVFPMLAACAAVEEDLSGPIEPRIEDDPRLGNSVDTVCFTGGLSGFFEVGNRAVVLRRSVDEAYLVRTGYCRNLRQIEGLELPGGSNGCLKRGDTLAIYDQPLPREGVDRPERCRVTAIHRWQDVDIDAPFYEEP